MIGDRFVGSIDAGPEVFFFLRRADLPLEVVDPTGLIRLFAFWGLDSVSDCPDPCELVVDAVDEVEFFLRLLCRVLFDVSDIHGLASILLMSPKILLIVKL
jgi:hypothetical protein